MRATDPQKTVGIATIIRLTESPRNAYDTDVMTPMT
jgi:hypothetical protein